MQRVTTGLAVLAAALSCTHPSTFAARSPDGTRCAVWLQEAGRKRRSIGMVDKLPKAWKEFRFKAQVATDGDATLEIVAPSSWGGTPGKALLDDIVLVQSSPSGMDLDLPEDFPALCGDAVRGAWLAVTARDGDQPRLVVSRVLGGERRRFRQHRSRGGRVR